MFFSVDDFGRVSYYSLCFKKKKICRKKERKWQPSCFTCFPNIKNNSLLLNFDHCLIAIVPRPASAKDIRAKTNVDDWPVA
jgi:hypothetical protein